ncbi:MAG: hypothetical protein E7297_02275 [Lachnospiraceae bacterium]|nr:hypothetical protein [Lachnospiraceae bacterium]
MCLDFFFSLRYSNQQFVISKVYLIATVRRSIPITFELDLNRGFVFDVGVFLAGGFLAGVKLRKISGLGLVAPWSSGERGTWWLDLEEISGERGRVVAG